MAASEHTGAPPCVWVGACAVDVATGQMLLGQWLDDELRSQVRLWRVGRPFWWVAASLEGGSLPPSASACCRRDGLSTPPPK